MGRRIPSGIPGLDSLIEGGFLEGSVILVTGGTGTGKTIFSSQFLWQGLLRGESGLYITLEEDENDIKEDALQFGWDFEKFEKKGLFKIKYYDPVQTSIHSEMIDEIKRINAKRVVVDSVSVMGLNIESLPKIRKMLLNLINAIKRERCTAILTSEIPENSNGLSRFGVEEFVADGVIILYYLGTVGEYIRSLQIKKMRRTKHGNDVYPIEITKKGLIIKK